MISNICVSVGIITTPIYRMQFDIGIFWIFICDVSSKRYQRNCSIDWCACKDQQIAVFYFQTNLRFDSFYIFKTVKFIIIRFMSYVFSSFFISQNKIFVFFFRLLNRFTNIYQVSATILFLGVIGAISLSLLMVQMEIAQVIFLRTLII